MNDRTFVTESEAETQAVARDLAAELIPGDIVALQGELGAGKTVFTKGIADALEVREEVTSPTFTLIHEYRGKLPVYHMDLYRLENREEILSIGVEDYLYGDGVCIVEWAEKLSDLLSDGVIRVILRHQGGTCREITIERR